MGATRSKEEQRGATATGCKEEQERSEEEPRRNKEKKLEVRSRG